MSDLIPNFELKEAITKACNFLAEEIKKELLAQGHNATGNLIDSIEVRIEQTEEGYKGQIWINDYAFILNDGVKAERVPYKPGSGAKTSKYISALEKWVGVIKPSLTDKERLSFAFAIAKTAKKEGHPTRGSYAYSSNGRRKSWAEYAIDKNQKKIEDLLELGNFMSILFDNFVTEQQRLIIT